MKKKKFKILNNQLCISIDAITEALGGDTKAVKKTVYVGLDRNKKGISTSYTHYPDPSDNRRKLIVVDSLPSTTQEIVRSYYINPLHYHHAEHFSDSLHNYIYDEDLSFFYSQLKENSLNLPTHKLDNLIEACGWLRMLNEQFLFEHFSGKKSYLYHAARVISSRSIFGLKTSNWRSLDRKLKAWSDQGRLSLIPKTLNNQNSKKLSDTGYQFIIKTFSNPIKLTAKETWKQYIIQAEQRGWKILGEERVRQIIMLPESKQIWKLSRDGSSVARNALERTIKRRRPSFPDALWSLDGLTVQLRYVEDGKVRSDLYSIIVMDAFSDKVVGYAIGTRETATLVQAALRSAGRSTMYMPMQLQYDNGSANLSQEVQDLLPRLSRFNFPTAPYNGKSKPIENLIGRLERLNMRHFPNFKGGNITSPSLSIKANPDFLEAQRKNKSLPTKDGAIAQFELVIQTHNNTKGKDNLTPNERYSKSHKLRRKMDYIAMVDAYWVERKYKARYTKDGLTIEVDKQRYTYEVEGERRGIEDMQFRLQWLGHRFTIKYDPDDLDQIHLYDNDIWIAMAVQKYEAPMAMIDREEGDGSIIHDALEQRKEYLNNMSATLDLYTDELEANGLPVDLDHNILHKDAYNRIESHILDDLLERTAQSSPTKPNRSSKHNTIIDLYSDEEADGSVIVEDID